MHRTQMALILSGLWLLSAIFVVARLRRVGKKLEAAALACYAPAFVMMMLVKAAGEWWAAAPAFALGAAACVLQLRSRGHFGKSR